MKKSALLITLMLFSQIALASKNESVFYVVDDTKYPDGLDFSKVFSDSIAYGYCRYPSVSLRQRACPLTEVQYGEKFKLIYQISLRQDPEQINFCQIQENVNGEYKTIFYKNFNNQNDQKNIKSSNYVCWFYHGHGTLK